MDATFSDAMLFSGGDELPQSSNRFVPFRDFKNSLTALRPQSLAERAEQAALEDERTAEMRAHLLSLYESVEDAKSFVDDNGQVFDCVPVEQQAALKGRAPAAAPDLSARFGKRPAGSSPPGSALQRPPKLARQDNSGKRDRYGNSMECPKGSVPVRRLTMDELSQYDSLGDFFRKARGEKGGPPRRSIPQAPATAPQIGGSAHLWAHAAQDVANWGGHSALSIWAPEVTNGLRSFSQHWYIGGTPRQTVECGWQAFPGMNKPKLFVFWTADNYQNTGSYNLDGGAFAQTNGDWTLDGDLNTISTDGGDQFELEVAWYLEQDGKWWLYLNGLSSEDAVGYYPTSIFQGGQMSQYATTIDYGGETVQGAGWPQMGSGNFASAGYSHAAYHRDVYYFTGPGPGGGMQSATLTPYQLSPSCYTVQCGVANPPWNSYFYFGGPGGSDCPGAPQAVPVT